MSEREVRELAKEMAGDFAPPGVRDLCKDMLDEPPDVVVLLRWAYEQHAWTQLGAPTTYTSVRCEALWDVIKELEKIVRLTDDGWEWVEEGE